jgi:alcohol dehydrogenase
MEYVVAWELEIVGSHGIQAAKYASMFDLITSGRVNPQKMIKTTVRLEDAPGIIESMGSYGAVGVTVIDQF